MTTPFPWPIVCASPQFASEKEREAVMSRHRVFLSVAMLLAAASIIAAETSHVPKSNTHKAVVSYVQDAAKVVEKSGPSCAMFGSADWTAGDYYIFVLGPDGKLVCHPRADMIGKPSDQIVNAKGDKVGDRIAKMGMADGKGWVDYLWPKPGQKTEESKSTYVMGVTGP